MLNPIAFGFLDFSKPHIALAILAGVSQYVQAKMMPMKSPAISTGDSKSEAMMSTMNKQMLYFMPALTVFICLSLPSGLAFYWFISTLLTIAQQWYMFRNVPKAEVVPGV
jgi:YidC/Oxa1 family membrane protein insertase